MGAALVALLFLFLFQGPMSLILAEERPPIELPEVVIIGKDISAFTTPAESEKESPPEMPLGFKIKPAISYEKADVLSSTPPAIKTAPPTKGLSCLFSNPLTADIASGFRSDAAKFKLGLYNFQQGKYNEAIDQFDYVVKNYRESSVLPAAYFWLGESYFQLGRNDRALESFLAVVTKYSTDNLWTYASYSAGWIYQLNGEYEKALQRFAPVKRQSRLEEGEIAKAVMYLSGQAYFRLKKYQESTREFTSYLEVYGSQSVYSAEALFWQAESLYKIKDFARAERLYREFLKNHPEHALITEARYGLAWSLLQIGEYTQALSIFRNLETEPQLRKGFDNSVIFGKMQAMLRMDNWAEALEEYKKLSQHSPSGSLTNQAALDLGLHAFQKKDYAEATRMFFNIVDNFPGSPNLPFIYFLIGESYYNSREYQKALPHYLFIIEKGPGGYFSEAALLREGLILLRLGNYKKAIEELQAHVNRYPNSELLQEATFWLAEARFLSQDYKGAVRTYQRVNPKGDRGMEASYGLGWAFFKLGDWARAAEFFNAFVQTYPKSPWRSDALFRMAAAKSNQRAYDEANSIYYELATQFPTSDLASKAYYQIGLNYHKLGKFDQAQKVFQLLVTKYPQSNFAQEAQYRTGEALFKEGKYSEARKQLLDFIQRNIGSPFLAAAWLILADSFYNEQNYEQALNYYRDIPKRFPSSPEAIESEYGALLTLYQQGEYSSFITGSKDFADKYPQHPLSYPILYQRAEHLLAKKDYAGALDTYTDLLRKNPKHELADDAQLSIAEIYFHTGQYSEAIRSYQSLLTDFPDSNVKAEAVFNLGKLFVELKDYSRALDYFRQLLISFPNSQLIPATLFESAKLLWEMQKKEEAITYLHRLISNYPESPFQNQGFLKLGHYYLAKEEHLKALEYFKKAIQSKEPDISAQAQLGFGQALAAMGDLKQSVAELLKIVYLFPEKKELVTNALLEAGGYYEKLGNWDEAIAVYNKILSQNKEEKIQTLVQNKIRQLTEKRKK